jgi:hypothetical protein
MKKKPIIKLQVGWENALKFLFQDVKGGRKEVLQRVKELTRMIKCGEAVVI